MARVIIHFVPFFCQTDELRHAKDAQSEEALDNGLYTIMCV